MSPRRWFLALACAAPLVGGAPVVAGTETPAGPAAGAGTLRAATPEAARSETLARLQATGRADPDTLKQFEALWAQEYRPVLDRVADTLALGDPQAGQLLNQARDPLAPAPTAVPALLKDESRPSFDRSNLGLAYAKALSNRRIHEEALAALRLVRPDQVVDPAAYFFHRAVAEHALGLKADAARSIVGLSDDVADAPERYRLVAGLMSQDMQGWRAKDLGDVARSMDNIERRLELARGGPHTQRIEKYTVRRLEEMIKRLENLAKGNSNGGC